MAKAKDKKDADRKNEENQGQEELLAGEIDALKGENDDLNSRILRLRADFDNFRKRTIKERAEIAQRSNENLLSNLIPVLDHFEMGLQTARENDIAESVYDGFKMVYDQLVQAVEKAGVVRIDADGEEFNPHLHECISHLPSEDVPEGVVSTQTRCGYKVGNFILRAAQVVVSSGPPPTAEQQDPSEDNHKAEEE